MLQLVDDSSLLAFSDTGSDKGYSTGLNQTDAVAQIQVAAGAGNERVALRGKDADGNRLSGTNDDIKLELAMDVPDTDEQKAEALATKYEALVSGGVLHQDLPATDHVPLLRRLFSALL